MGEKDKKDMGADLIIKYRKKAVNVGRLNAYQINGELVTDEDEIDVLWADTIDDLKAEIEKFVAYTPKSVDDLDQATGRIDIKIEEALDTLIKIGRMTLIVDLIKEGFKTEVSR
jgi:hypothetical protein